MDHELQSCDGCGSWIGGRTLCIDCHPKPARRLAGYSKGFRPKVPPVKNWFDVAAKVTRVLADSFGLSKWL